MSAMLIGTIDLYHFSAALTLAVGHEGQQKAKAVIFILSHTS